MFEKYHPDLDAFSDAFVQLAKLITEEKNLENELDSLTAQIYLDCTYKQDYYVNGKSPSATLIDHSYAKIGHTPETRKRLLEIKTRLAELEGLIESCKGIIKAEEAKLSMFQTLSANARNIASF